MQKKIDEGFAALEIMITEKGNSVTSEDITNLTIDPSCFDDDDDCCDGDGLNVKFTNNKIRKRKYIGDMVAIKQMPDIDVQIEKFAKQTKIISLLGSYGIYVENVDETDYLFVVTEWMENGNLQEYLSKNNAIPWKTKFKIAEQIARGLCFCSSVGIFHRVVRRYKTLHYFAVLLWEISSHQLPFGDIESHMKAGEMAKKGERPSPFSEDTPEQYRRIVEEAWHNNPIKRPTIDEVRKKLGIMRKGENCFPSTAPVETPVSDNAESAPFKLLPIDEVILLDKEKRYREAFPQFLQLAEDGNPLASYYAGLYLYNGTGDIEKDEVQALRLFMKSANAGEVRGQYMYAYACLKGSYYSKDEGLKYLKKAALKKNDPDALYMVSQLFLNGEHGHPINDNKYMEYLRNAAEHGSAEARSELSKMPIKRMSC
ncbi:15742_t:CDS:2 [Acaulospora colombiana]|uniref:15742_t:CDS:1 n=1 Tax=Acaulospora colombiana TaxID=27376 RepID=A0ACA9LY00_9GLOM|nr:15742_t:CDS:2 [Acaulospora colombiana]